MNNLLKFRFKAFVLIALLLVSAISAFAQEQIAIIDAGSSGSRLYVYRIEGEKLERIYPKDRTEEIASKGRALSGVDNTKESVKAFVQEMTQKYDPGSKTPLYILATAGMRLQKEDIANSIYSYMEGVVNNYEIERAMTISGRYEGLYAWIAANYDKERLGFSISTTEKPLTFTGKPLGIIEIGGASMQIAFAPNTPVDKDNIIKRKGFYIYSKSYLGGGVNEIYERKKDNKDNKDNKFEYSQVVQNLPNVGDVSFLGLSKPIEVALAGVKANAKKTFDAYIETLDGDTPENYHPKSNAEYIKWVLESLGLIKDGRVSEKIEASEADWTKGAALDILINKCKPEPYDYKIQN